MPKITNFAVLDFPDDRYQKVGRSPIFGDILAKLPNKVVRVSPPSTIMHLARQVKKDLRIRGSRKFKKHMAEHEKLLVKERAKAAPAPASTNLTLDKIRSFAKRCRTSFGRGR